MRKIALITASASLILCCSWVNKSKINLNQLEIENTAEDMIEWIIEDVAQGRIYQEYAEYYIYSLKIIVAKARKLRENE